MAEIANGPMQEMWHRGASNADTRLRQLARTVPWHTVAKHDGLIITAVKMLQMAGVDHIGSCVGGLWDLVESCPEEGAARVACFYHDEQLNKSMPLLVELQRHFHDPDMRACASSAAQQFAAWSREYRPVLLLMDTEFAYFYVVPDDMSDAVPVTEYKRATGFFRRYHFVNDPVTFLKHLEILLYGELRW